MQFGITHAGQPNRPTPHPQAGRCTAGGEHVYVKNSDGKLACTKCGALMS